MESAGQEHIARLGGGRSQVASINAQSANSGINVYRLGMTR